MSTVLRPETVHAEVETRNIYQNLLPDGRKDRPGADRGDNAASEPRGEMISPTLTGTYRGNRENPCEIFTKKGRVERRVSKKKGGELVMPARSTCTPRTLREKGSIARTGKEGQFVTPGGKPDEKKGRG